MNQVLETILNRKSMRAYEKKEITAEVRQKLLQATLRAPTAGNLMLYSILEISDKGLKDKLVKTCDDQPFIARAPLVWLFLADYQRWCDSFIAGEVPHMCSDRKVPMRKPEEGDLFLACCDALIAAQTAVIAAESLGLGSCYVGDIMENYEIHRDLFNLPQYVFPITLLCFGYPTRQQLNRQPTTRFHEKFILFENRYKRLDKESIDEMLQETQQRTFRDREEVLGTRNISQLVYQRKFNADFSKEMNRSVREIMKMWMGTEIASH